MSGRAAARLYLAVNLVAYLGFAGPGWLTPERLAAWIGIGLPTTTAVADFAAAYGGLSAAYCALFGLGIARPAWERPAVFAAAASCAGLLLGRVLTMARLGPAGPYIYASAAAEVTSLILGALLLRAGRERA